LKVVTGLGEAIGKSKLMHKHDSTFGCFKAAEQAAAQLLHPKLSLGPPFTSRLEICVPEARKPADFILGK
jgi:hypothetical protein